MSHAPDTESPCKLICTLDILNGVCTGCGRTRDDIAMWTRYSLAQRAFANIEAAKRLKAIDAKAAISARAVFAAVVVHAIAFTVLNLARSPIVPWDDIDYVPITLVPQVVETPPAAAKAVITNPAPAAPNISTAWRLNICMLWCALFTRLIALVCATKL